MENEIIESCQCNNCMRYFESDDELEYFEEDGERFLGCPECKTDDYLMQYVKEENKMIQIGDEVIIISNCGGFLEPKRFREEFGEDSLNGIIIDIDISRLNPYGVSFANGYSEIWLTLTDFKIK